MKFDLKKFLILNFPYVFMFWFFNRIGEGYRLADGADELERAMSAVAGIGETISRHPFPSFHPQDLLVGVIGAACIWAAVYIKAKNAKKYRHGVEYGSARWGTAEDIKGFYQSHLLLSTGHGDYQLRRSGEDREGPHHDAERRRDAYGPIPGDRW